MRQVIRFSLLLAFAMASMSAGAQGKPQRVDIGKHEFDANCASCHGSGGKGDGPVAGQLRKTPPDLTQLQRNNGGVFPFSRVYQVIEGADVASHGTREMPVWGWEYRVQAGEYALDPTYDRESYVRARILALTEYLSRLQSR